MKRGEFIDRWPRQRCAFAGCRDPRIDRAAAYEVTHSDAQWRALLGDDRYDILRAAAPSPPSPVR